ncbi:MAG: hypothetical protein IPG45_31365 [Deltaproteobacteria bacterium]|nr:hypothetical protein [Deltaproteobacteria bacterium]
MRGGVLTGFLWLIACGEVGTGVEGLDAGPADLAARDQGPGDQGHRVDAQEVDAGFADAGEGDAGEGDASWVDAAPNDGGGIRIEGRTLLVDGAPFLIRGVGWNPVRRGGTHPQGLEFAATVEGDSTMMVAAGINVVRTYTTIDDRAVLDVLWSKGLRVLMTVYAYGGEGPEVVGPRVQALADHPAILMWLIGNEWNYNGLYVGMSHADALARLNDVAQRIRAVDPLHPIATVYGELPSPETIAAMPRVDAFGINAYRGLSFYDLFDRYEERSTKPMFLAEYGADAYNANLPGEDQAAQALAVTTLAMEI